MENLENRKMRDYDELLRDVLVTCLLDSHYLTILEVLGEDKDVFLDKVFNQVDKKSVNQLVRIIISSAKINRYEGAVVSLENEGRVKLKLLNTIYEFIKYEKTGPFDIQRSITNYIINQRQYVRYWNLRQVEIFFRLLDMKYLEDLMEILKEADYLSQDAFIEEISSYVSKIFYKSCVFYNSGVDIKEQIDVLEGRRDNLKSFLVLKIKRLCNEQAN